MDGKNSLNLQPPFVQRFENLDDEGDVISKLTWKQGGWIVSTTVYDFDRKECSHAEIEIADPDHVLDPVFNGWEVLKQENTEVTSQMQIPEGWLLRTIIFDSNLRSTFCKVTFIKSHDPHHESKFQCA